MAATPGLTIRKLADRSVGQRVPMIDRRTGTTKLVNPDTPGEDHESWPLAGVRILDDPLPDPCKLSTNIIALGEREGWIELEGKEVVHRPGGPPQDVWRVTHSLVHVDAIVIKTVDGDVRYEVTRQPDKYVDGDDEASVTDDVYEAGDTIVDKFYLLKLVR